MGGEAPVIIAVIGGAAIVLGGAIAWSSLRSIVEEDWGLFTGYLVSATLVSTGGALLLFSGLGAMTR
jgi:hypothetical protein